VTVSKQFKQCTSTKTPFEVGDSTGSAESQANKMGKATSTVVKDDKVKDRKANGEIEDGSEVKKIESAAV
jgi:hypothetical protein